MRSFSFSQASRVLEDPSLARSLTALYEHKGKQALYLEARPDALDSLCEFAKVQSTDASNRIEKALADGVGRDAKADIVRECPTSR